MTSEIALTLFIVVITAVLFITEWLRADVVALLVLGALAVTGLVTPAEALSGFSNPAVVTVWAMFIISGGLAATGVANAIGDQVMRVAGRGEIRLLIVIMLTAALLSAFMNNVGVAALMLPVVMSIARRSQIPPSRLLMPLAFACLLGGLTTLIGTPPNILASDALSEAGLNSFGMFDFALVGVPLMLLGILAAALGGRYLLPKRDVEKETATSTSSVQATSTSSVQATSASSGQATSTSSGQVSSTTSDDRYHLQDRLFTAQIAPSSPLAGKTLAESRLGDVLGVNVVGIIRNGHTNLAPLPTAVLQGNDKLLVVGRREQVDKLRQQQLTVIPASEPVRGVETAVFKLMPGSTLAAKTLAEVDFRGRFGVNVLALRRNGLQNVRGLAQEKLRVQDKLVVQGNPVQITNLAAQPDFSQIAGETAEFSQMSENLLLIRIPPDSTLVGQTLRESQLGDVMGLTVLGRVLEEQFEPLIATDNLLKADDVLLVQGMPDDLAALAQLATLEVASDPSDLHQLETEQVGLVQATLSPYTAVVGKTLSQIHFREKFGLTVVAIWREGRPYRHGLAAMPLQLGDGLLLYGPRSARPVLAAEPDFILLEAADQPPLKTHKAPVALFIMALVLLPVILNWLPISIAAVMGALLMVITRCLSMDEAYRQIEWKAVFLIAGMLPLGIAMQTSGTADFLAQGMITAVAPLGILAVVAALFLLTNVASQIMPNAVVVVLMAPIVLKTAVDLQVSPYSLMMAVAIAASVSFLSPVGHPANVLVMGPGGYRFSDYVKLGLPLTLVIFVATMLLLPLFWPLQ
ncbi:MAG: SLC13 family permease [Anaerolineae bacterium]|nr:SLC13 family permease [Anaerolineae bacterium]